MRTIIRILAIVSVLTGCAFGDELEDVIKRVIEAYASVSENAADPLDDNRVFYEGVIPGMMRKLDPFSVFFDPGQFNQLKRLQTSTDKGFGSVVSILPGRVIVLQTLPATPSARSGMAAGDEILAINGYRLDRLDMDQLVGLLSEARQRQAVVDVRRPGNARILQFTLTPESMAAKPVDRIFLLESGMAYVRVTTFDTETPKQLKAAIEKLGGNTLPGLVLDLRNNPGGVVAAALEAACLFLEPGQPILLARGRKIPEVVEETPAGTNPFTFPVAVLLNEKTASAAEILAGALQDHDRATILGEPSYGKGLVQAVYPLSEGTGMALTTSFYFTPSGRSIQRPLPGTQLAKTIAEEMATPGRFRSDKGHELKGGGGIQPDRLVYQEPVTRFRMVLEATASFASFATEYLQRVKTIPGNFEISPALLDEFRGFLVQRNIQPPISEWSRERDWLSARLRIEILNQGFSVAKGEEVELSRDPVVLAAVGAIRQR